MYYLLTTVCSMLGIEIKRHVLKKWRRELQANPKYVLEITPLSIQEIHMKIKHMTLVHNAEG